MIQKEIENSKAPSAYGIELTDEASMLSGLIKINTSNGEIIQSSPVTYIRNRTMYQADSNFIAIAGENSGNGAVKLILLSPDTMEITAESNEIVSESSVLVQNGSDYYCVIQEGDGYALAKYGTDLTLKLKSNIKVKASTPITITDSYIIVTGASGAVKLLSKADLKVIEQSNPYADAK